MSERLVRPVRAWGEYDEWSVFALYLSSDWQIWEMPQTKNGLPITGFSASLYAAIDRIEVPLRSLRVLYENGYELKAKAREGTIRGTSDYGTTWDWSLWMPLTPGTVYAMPGPVASGSFPEDKDSEAVERAMIAAAAWFSQVEWATLGIDSPPPEPAS
jgi:hypothetical protein